MYIILYTLNMAWHADLFTWVQINHTKINQSESLNPENGNWSTIEESVTIAHSSGIDKFLNQITFPVYLPFKMYFRFTSFLPVKMVVLNCGKRVVQCYSSTVLSSRIGFILQKFLPSQLQRLSTI